MARRDWTALRRPGSLLTQITSGDSSPSTTVDEDGWSCWKYKFTASSKLPSHISKYWDASTAFVQPKFNFSFLSAKSLELHLNYFSKVQRNVAKTYKKTSKHSSHLQNLFVDTID